MVQLTAAIPPGDPLQALPTLGNSPGSQHPWHSRLGWYDKEQGRALFKATELPYMVPQPSLSRNSPSL